MYIIYNNVYGPELYALKRYEIYMHSSHCLSFNYALKLSKQNAFKLMIKLRAVEISVPIVVIVDVYYTICIHIF